MAVLLLRIIDSKSQPTSAKLVFVDRETGEPIPYATVVYPPRQGGTYSNEHGICVVDLVDSILIRHVAYKPLQIAFPQRDDTIHLERQVHELPEINVYPSKSEKKVRQKFSKRSTFLLSLPSFEIGRVISTSKGRTKNVFIPCKMPNFENLICLKIYSLKNGVPDSLIFREIQKIAGDSREHYLAFTHDVLENISQEKLFISIELISTTSDSFNVTGAKQKPMEFFLNESKEGWLTFHTRNFDRVQTWSQLLGPKREPFNLIVFPTD